MNQCKFDEDNIKNFMQGLSDEKLAYYVDIWDHSTTVAKYKIEQIMVEEPNLKNIDEVSELVTSFCDQFKDRFRASFTYNKIGEEGGSALKEAFNTVDTDRSGQIDRSELTVAIRAMDPHAPDHVIVDMIKFADADARGCRWRCAHAPSWTSSRCTRSSRG